MNSDRVKRSVASVSRPMFRRFGETAALLVFLCGWPGVSGAEPPSAESVAVDVRATRGSGIYHAGETITFRIEVHGDAGDPVDKVEYSAKAFGTVVLASGELALNDHSAEFQTSLAKPGALLIKVRGQTKSGREVANLAGAVVDPSEIKPSMTEPADFDSFWKAKLTSSAALPLNPQIESVADNNEPAIDYAKVTLDNINHTHVYGQVARPKAPGKYPAMLILQWAGVYALPRSNVIARAKEGWLAMNISAHDGPFDLTESEFKRLGETTLKDYVAIGETDRETSYFLRMFLGCQRAAEYLSQRADWDGRVLVATGTSQGGLQSIVTAALVPKISAIVISEPAGCDTTAQSAGRAFGWPYWQARATGPDAETIMRTRRYFDAVNFARLVKCPALVGVGLKETTCPAANVLAMTNTLAGPVEVLVLPNAGHQSTDKARLARFQTRSAEWFTALKIGGFVLEPGRHFACETKTGTSRFPVIWNLLRGGWLIRLVQRESMASFN